jgi:hypothetical protein
MPSPSTLVVSASVLALAWLGLSLAVLGLREAAFLAWCRAEGRDRGPH